MLHANTSLSQISEFGSFCVVISANPSDLFTCFSSLLLAGMLSSSLCVSPFSHSESSSKCISSDVLSLACPHHSIIIYRPFNDRRKSRKQKENEWEHCKLSPSLHLQKILLTSIALQDKVGQHLLCRAPQTLLVPNKYWQ